MDAWGLSELGSNLIVGGFIKDGIAFDLGLVEVDKTTLNRVGHFTNVGSLESDHFM